MDRLALYLLGPPRVEVNDDQVHIGRRKALALLAYLATTRECHRRDALATLLWPEYDQSRARADLRRTLSLLNRRLGEGWLVTDRETAGLDPDVEIWLDVQEFRQVLTTCASRTHPVADVCPDCLPRLEQALELYRGDFLAGFTLRDSLAFDEWQFFQTEELRQALASTLERVSCWHERQEMYALAISHATCWVTLDPTHEPAQRQLIKLYARAGQKSAALRQYQLLKDTLAKELGVTPAARTTALYERVRSGGALAREQEAPPGSPHNLPTQPTPFVGRTPISARHFLRPVSPAERR